MLYRDLKTTTPILLTENQPLVFVHIPKTAGTTFKQILFDKFPQDSHRPWDFMALPYSNFSDYRLYYGHFYYHVIQKLMPKPSTYMSFFRNPIERSISHYYYLYNAKKKNPHILDLQKTPDTLAEFIDSKHSIDIIDLQTRFLGTQLAFSTHEELTKAIAEMDNQVLAGYRIKAEDAYSIVDSLDFIGLTEEFDKSLTVLCHTFGWEPVENSITENVGSYKRPSQALINKIIDLNQEDLKLYDYAVKVFNTRYSQTITDLARHFFTTTQAYNTPRVNTMMYTFNQYSGSSWHQLEKTPADLPFMWSAQAHATIKLALDASQDLQVRFHVLSALTPETIESLRVYVNGHGIGLTSFPSAQGGLEFEGKITQTEIPSDQYYSEIMFEVARTLRPIDIDPTNPDERFLGVALTWLKIRPQPPKTQTAATVPLPLVGMNAAIQTDSELSLTASHIYPLPIELKNISSVIWPSLSDENGENGLKMGAYWVDSSGRILSNLTQYFSLPHDITPNESATIELLLQAPDSTGAYTLAVNMTQCITPWFIKWFSNPARMISVTVQETLS